MYVRTYIAYPPPPLLRPKEPKQNADSDPSAKFESKEEDLPAVRGPLSGDLEHLLEAGPVSARHQRQPFGVVARSNAPVGVSRLHRSVVPRNPAAIPPRESYPAGRVVVSLSFLSGF